MSLKHKFFRHLMKTPAYGLTLGAGKTKNTRVPSTVNNPSLKSLLLEKAIMNGYLTLDGTEYLISDDIWRNNGPNKTWFELAHSFFWLNDLISPLSPKTSEKAVFLIDKWIDNHSDYSARVWRPDLTGRRIINWVCSAPFLINVSGPSFQDRFWESISKQYKHLRRTAQFDRDGAARITALIGLITGEAVFTNENEISGYSNKALKIELERQVLADGVHGSRSPEIHANVLSDLILLRELLISTGVTIPESLFNAIDRMTPILKFFQHGDGALAQFNGGGETSKIFVERVLKIAACTGNPPKRAPHAGFERLASGSMTAIIDTGAPSLFPSLNPAGHAGSLSLEVSIGKERLLVNCGSCAGLNSDWCWACRTTAAHSTLVINDTNSCRLTKDGGTIKTTVTVSSDRGEADGNCWFSASHDGYVSRFGLTHRRRLYVDKSGLDLRGEDTLIGDRILPFAVRFHLHPNINVLLRQNRTSALLRTKSGSVWNFLIANGQLDLEESVYLGESTSIKRSNQLVIYGKTFQKATTVKWALRPENKL